ncbi:MAG: hypothetical protein A2Y15_00800 [Clostridiales bacterium GWF2_36_10]|nr:MAG: hypothetical protein A2Y15_00800 [Clostridiales bacterium GWF2_36_10]HAN21493.1 hypothetical protein [Clostridiales bacterium]
MKKTVTAALAILTLSTLASCNRGENNESTECFLENDSVISDVISVESNELSETSEISYTETGESKDDTSSDDSYDFVNKPFKNKDGIIDLSEYAPFGDVIENEELRQELIPVVKKIFEAKEVFSGLTRKIDFDNPIIIDGYLYFFPLLPEIATTKDELFSYVKRNISDNYIYSFGNSLEEIMFGDEEFPSYKIFDDKIYMSGNNDYMCFINFESLMFKSIEKDRIKVKMVCAVDPEDHKLINMTLIKSDAYGWRLEEESYEPYNPENIYFNYLLIENADKINLILKGSRAVLENGEKVIVEHKGIKYEKIEKFMSIYEMTKYFQEIMTEEAAKLYIQKFIYVYYEKGGCLYRQIGAVKGKMYDYVENSFSGYIDFYEGKVYGSCKYKDDKGVIHDQELFFSVDFKNDDVFMLKLTSLKMHGLSVQWEIKKAECQVYHSL